MRIELVIGDWSHDGHSKSDTIMIDSNLTVEEIEKAYKKATKILGFDFCEDVASEYEDNELPQEIIDAMEKNGLEPIYDYEDEDSKHLFTDEFVDNYLSIVKLGNPDFECSFVEAATIRIGGYGLFY